LCIADIPIITGISVTQADSAIAVTWNSDFAEVYRYRVSLTTLAHGGRGVTTSTIFTHEKQHTFYGTTYNTSYWISVTPRNLGCRGKGMRLAWSSVTGNFVRVNDIVKY